MNILNKIGELLAVVGMTWAACNRDISLTVFYGVWVLFFQREYHHIADSGKKGGKC